MKRIKVIIVDDSLLFREVISRGISLESSIEVVAKANDPFDARDKIIEFDPDVMICDVHMPKMDGIKFISKLMPQHPIPVIVVSTISNTVFDAMNAGAVDFVTKPDVQSARSVELFINELIEKIKVASTALISRSGNFNEKVQHTLGNHLDDCGKKIIAIGASTGGTEAIYSVLKAFPSKMPPIVIVQHIPPVFSRMFAERLNNSTNLNVKEAKNGDFLEEGQVLIAPGDRHMKIKRVGNRFKVECFEGEKVNGHCPSVDVLFESVAKEAGSNAVGVILTGMGHDGAKGLFKMRKMGASTIGQDKNTSVVYGMPKVAFEIGAVEKQASLVSIPQHVISVIRKETLSDS